MKGRVSICSAAPSGGDDPGNRIGQRKQRSVPYRNAKDMPARRTSKTQVRKQPKRSEAARFLEFKPILLIEDKNLS